MVLMMFSEALQNAIICVYYVYFNVYILQTEQFQNYLICEAKIKRWQHVKFNFCKYRSKRYFGFSSLSKKNEISEGTVLAKWQEIHKYILNKQQIKLQNNLGINKKFIWRNDLVS